jgi:[ribosomal protein S18]-alanine N-acetyltransferase
MEIKNKVIVSIRKFSLKDLGRIIEIEHKSFTTDAFSENTFLSLYRKCSDLFIVAEVSGIITGYMVTCNYWKKQRVVSIAVDPVYRHKGVGSALVKFTFYQLRASYINTLELEVRISNSEGICFWKNLGFFTLKIVPNYYLDGANALIMRKLLESQV